MAKLALVVSFRMRPTFLLLGAILLAKGVVTARVYADVVVLLNFLVDFLLLLGTNRLSGFPPGLARSAGAAALGSLYAAGCLMPGFSFLAGQLWRLVSLAGMGVVAFGWNKSALRRCSVFLLLSMALAGIAISLNKRGTALLPAAAVMAVLCRVCFGGRLGGKEYVPVTLHRDSKSLTLTALVDTGNGLRDPATGESVVVISPQAAETLTGLTRAQLADPLGTLASRPIPGLRLVPYRSVGQDTGLLLALRFQKAQIRGRERDVLVAFAPSGLGQAGMVQALTGGNV